MQRKVENPNLLQKPEISVRGVSPHSLRTEAPCCAILDIMAIPLTQGLFALVDGEDFERLNRHKWCAAKGRHTYYAVRSIRQNEHQAILLMHREILQVPKGMETDHKNHYGLDNRKRNIRICTATQNQHNRLSYENTSSKYKGIHWHKAREKWMVKIKFNGKRIHLGYFDNEIEAAKAYDKAAKEFFGEFARTNFANLVSTGSVLPCGI